MEMLGISDLRVQTEKINGKIKCHVKNCETSVDRMDDFHQRRLKSYLTTGSYSDINFNTYLCNNHEIYLSETTFIYKNIKDNLLWYDATDEDLLKRIMVKKRFKQPLGTNNSEDAVSWNVFRFLEKNDLLSGFLTKITGKSISDPKVIYWSFCQFQNDTWGQLTMAQKEFGEKSQGGSEPDIIILSNEVLFLIEAKLLSKNETKPPPKRIKI